MKINENILEELENINISFEKPIIAPLIGENYTYNNYLLKVSFDFVIIDENKEYYSILINDEHPDILKKDWELLELFNAGYITKTEVK